jgi:polyhydroxyalkanoate synthesis regulator phasin
LEDENAELRENIRMEREQLELIQQEQQRALDDLLEQRHGAESRHTKREDEMQQRIRGLESDLKVARPYAE